jgi:outer membrane protein assembly factor BamD (BamD/ComL family)
MKKVLITVKIIIFLAACIVGYVFYQKYTESQQKQAELKKINALYNDDKWEEAIPKYKDYIQKYPEKKASISKQLSTSLQNIANDKSLKAIGIPKSEIKKKQNLNREVIKLLEEAKNYGQINEASLMILCDAYIECKEYTKAQNVIKEAKKRSSISANKFFIQENQIKRALKKK